MQNAEAAGKGKDILALAFDSTASQSHNQSVHLFFQTQTPSNNFFMTLPFPPEKNQKHSHDKFWRRNVLASLWHLPLEVHEDNWESQHRVTGRCQNASHVS